MKSTQRSKSKPRPRPDEGGRLKIGDDWNAIRIIALSQSNPLKAIAEFVENSIDAHAKSVTITRGREHGAHYLAIKDDGDGVPRDADGLPDFKYVATHICDSIKRHLKAEGKWCGASGRIRDRAAQLSGPSAKRLTMTLHRRRPARLPDDHEQGRLALQGEPAARALRRAGHRAQGSARSSRASAS